MITNVLDRVILSKEDIQKIVTKLATEINNDYKGKELLIIGILKGCNPFMSHLMMELDLVVKVDYMEVSSFFGQVKSSGEIKVIKDLTSPVKDKEILIVEDILDSGRTVKLVLELLELRKAKNIEVVTLLNKQAGRTVDLNAKYIGFEIENEFLVGYGLDYDEKYRNIYAVGIPKKKIIQKADNEK